jgi:hypothetical protein
MTLQDLERHIWANASLACDLPPLGSAYSFSSPHAVIIPLVSPFTSQIKASQLTTFLGRSAFKTRKRKPEKTGEK